MPMYSPSQNLYGDVPTSCIKPIHQFGKQYLYHGLLIHEHGMTFYLGVSWIASSLFCGIKDWT